ncbi:hypothetical protein HQ47_07490 [Porphyromonas macacae]|uniref:Uncharacterized protein n=1 Tax=Porphyromonas macacae TaxID=28115 RepID=A0A0A2E6S6_9PORP|nr:hypothetical protein HQ47_07490 [Porphyromonas macacae]
MLQQKTAVIIGKKKISRFIQAGNLLSVLLAYLSKAYLLNAKKIKNFKNKICKIFALYPTKKYICKNIASNVNEIKSQGMFSDLDSVRTGVYLAREELENMIGIIYISKICRTLF